MWRKYVPLNNKNNMDKIRLLNVFINENKTEGIELIFKKTSHSFDSVLDLLNKKREKIENRINELNQKFQNTEGVDPDSIEAKILKRKMLLVSLLFSLALLSEIFFAFKSLEGLSGLKSFVFFIAIVILPTLSAFLSLHFGLIPIKKRNLSQSEFEIFKEKVFLIPGIITLTGFITLSIARAIAFADELLDTGFSENTVPLFFSTGFTISLIGSSLISGVLLFLVLDFYENEYIELLKKQNLLKRIKKLEKEKENIEHRIGEIKIQKKEIMMDLALKFMELKTIRESHGEDLVPIPSCVQEILSETNINQNIEEDLEVIPLTNEGGEV